MSEDNDFSDKHLKKVATKVVSTPDQNVERMMDEVHREIRTQEQDIAEEKDFQTFMKRQNPQTNSEICKRYYRDHREQIIERTKQYRQLHPEEEKKRSRRYKQSIKRFVLSGLSNSENPLCHCCGETNLAFLTIGHEKDGDGKVDRLERGVGFSFYCWLVCNYLETKTWPTNIKTECFNCNCGKNENGICPHKLVKT